ncbi:cytospin-A-like [Bombus pyrosoma]|uniref:cytospin-A-like n=1 Tax=Bombus pyrosoma TaxID=396416 RepID=UPI001CB91AFE|nr:cytospin-A-like [Bombus pyrosoma]
MVVLANQTLHLRNTELGWIVTGQTVVEKQPQESSKRYNTERKQKLVEILKGAQEERESLLQKQEELTSEVKSLRVASEVRAAKTERLTKRVQLLESSVETASIERKQLDMELAEARQEGAKRNIEISRLATLLENARAKIEELEQSRQEQATEWKQSQTDLLTSVRVTNKCKTEAQSKLEQVMMENKAQRVKLRALEAQLDKLNKANQKVMQQPQQRLANRPTETQHCVLTSVQQEIAARRKANISHQNSRPSVKCLIERIENATKQAKAGSGSRSSYTSPLNSIGTNDTMTLKVPLQWPMGRMTSLHPGPDGITRQSLVTVRTSNGEYKRGVNKIAITHRR